MVNLQQLPLNTPTLYVTFSSEVTPQTAEALIAVMTQASTKSVSEVYLALSTPGGQVMAGMNLYNLLKGMPFDLVIHNVGQVNSIGNAVFLAGKRRYATPDSTFMFHGVGFDITRQARFEERDLRDRLDGILSDQKRIGNIIATNSNLNEREVATLFRGQQTKDAAWAVDKGIIHEIRPFQLPAGKPVISLVFQRQSV